MASVKNKYKLPFHLDTSTLDIELDLTAKNSNVSLTKRPVTVRLFMFGLIAIVAWIGITWNTGIANGHPLAIFLWSVAYFWLMFMLLSPTKTQQMGYSWLRPSLYAFFSSLKMFEDRSGVKTTGSSPTGPFEALVDVKEVTPDGIVKFVNNDVGEIFEIVGYGSVLMFDSDRNGVLADAANFYRNLPLGVSVIFDTQQAPQKVYEQRQHLRDQARKLRTDSKGLRSLQKYEDMALKEYVGKTFKSTRQLMIVRAIDDEHLQSFHDHMSTLQGGHFIRSVEVYEQEDIYKYLKDLKGREN